MPLTEDIPKPPGMTRIGVIAGGGQFPVLICRAARSQGIETVVLALEGVADQQLAHEADLVIRFRMGQAGKLIAGFRDNGVTRAIMAGTVPKTSIFSWRPDRKLLSLLPRMGKLHDDALLRLLAEVMAEEGVEIVDSTLLLPQLRTPAGKLTKRRVSRETWEDGRYGFRLAKDLGRFDIGQCLVIRSKAVLAVEAAEGTDETIRRGGRLGGGQAMVVKVSKPGQDLRFDLPALGLGTIRTMIEADCRALIVEAGQTICFDREEMIDLADRHKIAVLAMTQEEVGQ